jgi:hypothetical protein
MIIGTHAAIHSTNPEKDARILRDVMQLEAFEAGAATIFRLPVAEVHAHPADKAGVTEFFLMCRDVEEFLRRMGEHEVECAAVTNVGWGLMTEAKLPGGTSLAVYQPLYPVTPG